MAFPPRWVRDGRIAVAARCGSIENPANAIEHPPRSLGMRDPKPIERAPDQSGIDRGDRQLAKDRVDVFVEGDAPLAGVFGGPAFFLRSNIRLGGVCESLRLSGISTARQLAGRSSRDRVLAGMEQLALRLRCSSRIGKAYRVQRPEPHI